MSFIQTFNSCFDFVETVDKTDMFHAILVFMTVMFLWENYLSYRQFLVEKKTTSVPKVLLDVIDEPTFQKSRVYAIDKGLYSFAHGFYSQIETYLILFYGALPMVWNLSASQLKSTGIEWLSNEIATSILFVIYFMIYSKISDLPWSLYHTFVLEEKHGFNKQTISFYFQDKLKKFILTIVLTIPILSLLIYIIRIGGEYFFIYAWLFTTIITLLLLTIYMDFIAPIFDKYKPLEEGNLRTRIEELAKSLDYPLYKLYVVEGSKRSAHSNAYMYGFYKNKRIVLFDTLIEGYKPTEENKNLVEGEKIEEKENQETVKQDEDKQERKQKGCNTEEILAVLAHELGHWKLNHNIKNLILSNINTFLYFLIFAVLMNRQVFYEAFGFVNEKPVFIGLIIIVQFIFAPYNELISFLLTALSRRFEFQADAFAKSLGKAEYLNSSLVKLHKDNLSFPVTDWLYSTWHYSHPPLIERLKALEDSKDKEN